MNKGLRTSSVGGLTLPETMVVLAILAILGVVAAPSMSNVLHANRLAADSNDLLAALALTRSTAIKAGQRAVVCKGTPASGCSRGGEGWQGGWMVFVDTNNNALFDAAVAGERLVATGRASRGARVSGNTPIRHYVSYTPLGFTRSTSGALQMGTFTVCRMGVSDMPAKELVLNRTGRVRLARISSLDCPGP